MNIELTDCEISMLIDSLNSQIKSSEARFSSSLVKLTETAEPAHVVEKIARFKEWKKKAKDLRQRLEDL